jgi:hypothetical protein
MALGARGELLRSTPVDAELAEPAAVLDRGGVGPAEVQLFGQIQRQFFGALRFDDNAILLESKAVPLLQLLVRTKTETASRSWRPGCRERYWFDVRCRPAATAAVSVQTEG